MLHQKLSAVQGKVNRRYKKMTFGKKEWIILILVIIAGIVLGRLAVRAVMNLLLGGTLFGGNFL